MIKQLLARYKRPLLIAIIVIGLPSATYAAYCKIIILTGNFHAVVEGQYYRSAQLSKEKFIEEIDRHQIKSVLNLRGSNPGSPWYDEEIAAMKLRGITHYDFGISARKPVTVEKINQIMAIIRNAPKPILVHCQAGADRTGLVTALYRYVIQHRSPEDADKELSLVYGHFPYLTSKTGAMDASFLDYIHTAPPSTNPAKITAIK